MPSAAGTSKRLFIALWPDARVRAALAARRDAWQWPPGATPVPWAVRDYALVVSAGGEYAVMERYT
jgi:hypothetical protein